MCRTCTVTPSILALALVIAGCAPKEPPTPEGTVKQFLSLANEGKWDDARKLLVLDSKAQEMFGELYQNGDAAEKQRTQDILAERLRSSLEKEQEALAKEPPVYDTLLLGEAKDKAQVSVKHGETKFLYTLQLYPDWNQQGPAWIIHDRTHEKSGVRANSKTGVKAILRQIEKKLGHQPTLKELNDTLPEAMGGIRVRNFRVGSPGPGGAAAQPIPAPNQPPAAAPTKPATPTPAAPNGGSGTSPAAQISPTGPTAPAARPAATAQPAPAPAP